MKICLNWIGKIKAAEVVLPGITVIAGENNTGKSTVGKALYATLHSAFHLDESIREERIKGILNSAIVPRLALREAFGGTGRECATEIIRNFANGTITTPRDVHALLLDSVQDAQRIPSLESYSEEIFSNLQIPQDEIAKCICTELFTSEFATQINDLHSDNIGRIRLELNGAISELIFRDNYLVELDNLPKLYTDVLYIDDPFALHNERQGRSNTEINNHRRALWECLQVSEKHNIVRDIRLAQMLEEVNRKLKTVCAGSVKTKSRKLVYDDGRVTLNVDNLSAGLKAFAIIKTLLQNATLEYNATVILDEPEIHLHPEWQVKFAEIIVLLQQSFHLHILLNTHSPYFLNAIEAYAQKYGVEKLCRYYLAEDEGEYGYVQDVTNNTELIYQKLAHPLQVLEDIDND